MFATFAIVFITKALLSGITLAENITLLPPTTEKRDLKSTFFDISEILQNDVDLSNAEALQVFEQIVHSSSPFFFLETDFGQLAFQQIAKLSTIIDGIRKDVVVSNNSGPTAGILVSFRYNSSHAPNISLEAHKYVLGFSFRYMITWNSFNCLGATPSKEYPSDYEISFWKWSSPKPYLTRTFHGLYDTLREDIIIGLTLDMSLIQCRALFKSIRSSSLLIVNIPLAVNKQFVSSYAIFKRLMAEQTTEILKTLGPVVSDQGYLLRPHIQDPDVGDDFLMSNQPSRNERCHIEVLDKYKALVNVYTNLWMNEINNNKFGAIQEIVVSNVEKNQSGGIMLGNTKNHKQNCTQNMTDDHWMVIPHLAKIRDADWMPFSDICTLKTILLELLKAGFDTVVFSPRIVKSLFAALQQDNVSLFCTLVEDSQPNNISRSINIIIELDLILFEDNIETRNLTQALTDLSFLIKINLVLGTVIIPQVSNQTDKLLPHSKFSGIYTSGNETTTIKQACIAHTAVFAHEEDFALNIINDTEEACLHHGNAPSTFIWKLEFDFYHLQLIDSKLDTVLKRLDRYLRQRHKVQDKYPNVRVVLMISGGIEKGDSSPWNRFQSNRYPLYCNEQADKFSEFYEAVLTWARIHDFPVILQENKLSNYDNPVRWQRIEATNSFENEPPIYIRRLYNTSQVVGTWANGAYPCMPMLETFPQSGIHFEHDYSGATLDLKVITDLGNVTVMTAEEAQVLLLFSLYKFPVVEIITGKHTHLKALETVLEVVANPIFERNLKINGIQKRKINLDIPMVTLKQETEHLAQILTKLSSILQNANIQVEIQFSEWQSLAGLTSPLLKYFQKKLSILGVDIGLVVPKCEDVGVILVNETESTVVKLENVPFHLVDFIVCRRQLSIYDIKGSSTKAWFLEGCLYLQKLLLMFFPNLESVRFRLDHALPEEDVQFRNTEDTLKFLRDVNNFAESYKIFFLLIPTFIFSGNSTDASWWELTNQTASSLTDLSIYQDIQSQFQNKASWRPVILKGRTSSSRDTVNSETEIGSDWVSWSVLSAGVFLFFITIILGCKISQRSRLLSDQEVNNFLNGRKESLKDANGLNNYGRDYAEFDGMEFKTEFEIPCSSIHLDKKRILGTGKFGIVYGGVLEDHANIAVKMPHGSFSKETFMGMLSEVKLMCYIGSHENLVKFVGCYTKEIRRGILYVVMELCEEGSLFSYLRKMERSYKNSEFPELVRFCREIACGMDYISSQRVIHGDLATRNVLLDSFRTCKIGDFGLSRRLYEYQTYVKKNEEPLPWRWMAYESLKRLEFSTQSDVWSYGVSIWEIFSLGDVPYPGVSWSNDFVDQLGEGLQMTKPRFANQEIYDLMRGCWRIDSKERPSFTEIANLFMCLTQYENIF